MSEHPFRLSRRARAVSLLTAFLLAATVVLVWATPQGQRFWRGPTQLEDRLQSQTARADDLATQLADAQARLEAPRPPAVDGVASARAADLKRQVVALEAKVVLLSGRAGQLATQEARAKDLAGRVAAMSAALSRTRPSSGDPAAVARASDLKHQVDALSWKIAHRTPEVEPPVVAGLTKAQLLRADKLFGLYTAQSPFDYGEFNQVQATVDRDADVSGYFQSWDTDFRPDAVKAAWQRGQIPLLTWESQSQVGVVSADAPKYSLSTITAGDHDAYLHRYARAIKATGLPLVLRFDHEMNGTWYPWSEVRGWDHGSINGNHKGDYVTMWKHVHDVFQQEGANDLVVWLWSPNRVNKIPSQPDPKAFYPGDDYVDWIGLSGYYRPGDPAPTFDDTYGKTLPKLRDAAHKPIFLSEIGATEGTGHKPEWITSLFGALGQPANADIIGLGWFNLTVTGGPDTGGKRVTNDWRITSTGDSARAMAAGLKASGFGTPH